MSVSEALMQLYEIVTLLRGDGGCPWDREQTPKETALNLIEESYEFLDATEDADIKEELGDVLLNAMMLLEMHQENESIDGISALNGVCEKLIRRHPHVFGDIEVQDSAEVLDVWNAIKVEVEGKSDSAEDLFNRIPGSMGPLEQAYKIQKKLAKVGFDWPAVDGVVEKVLEELDEVREAYSDNGSGEDLELEIGDLLFAVVNLSRFLGYDPSYALHRANQKVKKRFNGVYTMSQERSIPLNPDHLDEMEALWQEMKEREGESNGEK
ncbi:MAG: nucleoside triphosphate pyrophosphohydrolase [Sphaerochaeta sp.]